MTISLYGRNRNTKYELDKQLREGGEGVVYTIKGQSGFVAKIYRPEHVSDSQLRNARRDKILAMLDMGFDPYYRGNLIVAWPKDALFDGSGSFVGFVMPKIENKKSLIWATRPSDRVALWTNGYRWQYSIAIAFNLALAIELMHQAGIVVGDMNPNNILINATGEVTLIDADSFNITEKNGRVFKCIVGIAEVLPAELQGKDLSKPTSQFNEKTDDFSLAVHIFNLLCNNCHPFGCLNFNVAKGSIANPQIMDNIVKGYCPYVSGSTVGVSNMGNTLSVVVSSCWVSKERWRFAKQILPDLDTTSLVESKVAQWLAIEPYLHHPLIQRQHLIGRFHPQAGHDVIVRE